MASTHRLSRQHLVYSLDKTHPPALEIAPGDTVVLETYDARTGTIQRDEDLLDHPHPKGSNPATGPILVRGAEPGDALCVEIQQIELAPRGFLGVKAGMGLLGELAGDFATRIVPIEGDQARFGERLRFPIRPMVGVIGTAPAGEGVSTGFPGPHGGNMDNRYVAPGSRVYLPVNVPGALLGIGDVHGAMGDGEITYIGLEICAEVSARVELLKGKTLRRPLVETAEYWITTGDHPDTAQALRVAAEEMVRWMQERMQLSFAEAYMLMSAVVDVQICQCCGPGEFPVTTRAMISKALIP
ncbi:MAG: acetamidase/formamidase family protein [Candidatus Latescibacteria bacterium]|nr:acetamidase/formamidase family protein [Candidatus Latescibacterota bacterium]